MAAVLILSSGSLRASAQEKPPPDPHAGHQTQQPAPTEPHQHHSMGAGTLFDARESSGTAWLPALSPMYGIHHDLGTWQVMFHGNAFLQSLLESGDRGSDQIGSINWAMAMARRPLGNGRFGLRGMLSLEPWTIGGCGYPDLLATGEVCEGETIHDRQHPHDFLMELAAEYDRPLARGLRLHLYGGIAGEPALGPVAFPHRLSAMPNPLAPTAHHWLDATHITFGVATAGISGSRWKAEASSFNGREPDDERADLDLARLDSFSGRVWFLPTSQLVFQLSAGRLTEAELGHENDERVDVARVTASATYHRSVLSGGLWATTVAWGRNEEEDESTHALLAETSLTLAERDSWFGRLEIVGKSGHDLDVHGTDEVFTVAKLQGGYTRSFSAWRGLTPGIGASVSLGIVPARLSATYGGRMNPGLGVFLTVRPSAHATP